MLLAADGTAKIADVGLAALAAGALSAARGEAAFPYAAPSCSWELAAPRRCAAGLVYDLSLVNI